RRPSQGSEKTHRNRGRAVGRRRQDRQEQGRRRVEGRRRRRRRRIARRSPQRAEPRFRKRRIGFSRCGLRRKSLLKIKIQKAPQKEKDRSRSLIKNADEISFRTGTLSHLIQ